MRARLPSIDFSSADPRWIPGLAEFSHRLNGASLLLPYLEPYLIKVMRAARPEIQRIAPHLVDDIDMFNRQEANHYRVHAAYNRELLRHYPGLDEFEAEVRSDFESFLSDRPLEWNLAYCEGFESLGVSQSEFFLEAIDDVLEDADPAVRELWDWHLAEEFEHRCVAHDVLAALHPGWLRRVKGFVACTRHLFGFTGRVAAYLEQVDRERGVASDDAESRNRAREFATRERRFMAPRVRRVFMPGYSPHPRSMQPNTRRVLESYV